MTQKAAQMPPARRRTIPGTSNAGSAPPPPRQPDDTDSPLTEPAPPRTDPTTASPPDGSMANAAAAGGPAVSPGARRQPAADYATTRLVNFRIPVDLHDRYRQLVRDTEREHPRLRHPSLTEVLIALLEEGPQSPGEVAELIRRKRAAEHGLEL